MESLQNKKWPVIAFGIVLIVIIYLCYFLLLFHPVKMKSTKATAVSNDTIYFERPKLKIFDENMRYINEFPDQVIIHNNYFLVIVPEDWAKGKIVTTVYDTRLKRKIASFHYVAFDYDGKNFLYSKDGIDTFFGNIDLHVHCTEGVIKNASSILCITPNTDNPQTNKLIVINSTTLKKSVLYASQNFLSAVNFINGNLYVGERNIKSGKSFLTVNGKTVPTQTAVQIIYPIGNKVFFATRSDRFSDNQDVYFEINTINNQVTTKLMERGRIIFY